MKSLVFPIIGSLVIGGGAITAPIYAPFIEKAIEDGKEPGPLPEPPPPGPGEYTIVKIDTESIYDDDYIDEPPRDYNEGDKIVFVCDLNAFNPRKRIPGKETWYLDVFPENSQKQNGETLTIDFVYVDTQLMKRSVDPDNVPENYFYESEDIGSGKNNIFVHKTIQSREQKFYFYVTFAKTVNRWVDFSYND